MVFENGDATKVLLTLPGPNPDFRNTTAWIGWRLNLDKVQFRGVPYPRESVDETWNEVEVENYAKKPCLNQNLASRLRLAFPAWKFRWPASLDRTSPTNGEAPQ